MCVCYHIMMPNACFTKQKVVVEKNNLFKCIFDTSKIHLNEWSKKTIVQKEIYKNTSKENGYKSHGAKREN